MTTLASKSVNNESVLQLVSFRIAKEEFGLDILMIQEINRMMPITKVPRCPDYVDGIINLRGRVIPIINLRKKFGLASKDHDKQTRIVVVNVNEKMLGLIVDEVDQVLRLPSDKVEPPPPMVSGIDAEYIQGVGKIDEKLLILLDLKKLLSVQDHTKLEQAAA